jgi:hypothetical protein
LGKADTPHPFPLASVPTGAAIATLTGKPFLFQQQCVAGAVVFPYPGKP